jgi:hypothetical protein
VFYVFVLRGHYVVLCGGRYDAIAGKIAVVGGFNMVERGGKLGVRWRGASAFLRERTVYCAVVGQMMRWMRGHDSDATNGALRI